MKRIKAHKLEEKALEEEHMRLNELKRRLKEEFGKCLWENQSKGKEGKELKIYIGGIKTIGMATLHQNFD